MSLRQAAIEARAIAAELAELHGRPKDADAIIALADYVEDQLESSGGVIGESVGA
jgi:hypothetical protein